MYNKNLKKLRIQNKIPLKTICNLLNMTKGCYSHFESEDDIMPIKHLITLADFYQVSIDYIFDLTNSKSYPNFKVGCNLDIMSIRLKEFRKDNKLTQIKLSTILKVAKGTFSNYECKRNIIATPFLYTICKKYYISADYLLGKTDNPKYLK